MMIEKNILNSHTISSILKSALLLLVIIPCNSFALNSKKWEVKELSKKDKEQITALSNLYGYVRYYYPNDNLEDFDWYKFLILSVAEIEGCNNTEELKETLYTLFQPICPQLSFEINAETMHAAYKKRTPFYIRENRNEPGGIKSEIKKIDVSDTKYPVTDSLYCFSIHSDLKVSLPIAVSSLPQKSKQLSKLKSRVKKVKVSLFNKSLLGVLISGKKEISFIKSYNARIANEIMRSNVVNYFYPFCTEDKLFSTWGESCKEHWGKVALCNNAVEYYAAVCELMHSVKDSHTSVNFVMGIGKVGTYSSTYFPEIQTSIYNGKLYIQSSKDKTIPEGSIITKINNIETDSIIQQKLKKSSYSNLNTGLYKIQSSLIFESMKKDSLITLNIQYADRPGTITQITTTRSYPYAVDVPFMEIRKDSLAYVNLTSPLGSYEIFETKIPELKNAKGIIFDLRGYAQPYAMSILANITEQTMLLGNLSQPISYDPNQLNTEYIPVEKWDITPATSPESKILAKKSGYQLPANYHIATPCVFLMDYSSISYTETLLDMVKHYQLGTIIGENSAGCNGDMTYIKLPFASFSMTGWKFSNRDGSQHHGIGIIPDIVVENEYDKDNQLKTAITYMHKMLRTL